MGAKRLAKIKEWCEKFFKTNKDFYPGRLKHKNEENTKKWCGGKVGKTHIYREHNRILLVGLVGTFKLLKCSICGHEVWDD